MMTCEGFIIFNFGEANFVAAMEAFVLVAVYHSLVAIRC